MIEDIAKDIKDMSADINILAINSAIEAAHATLVTEKLTESILDNLMTTQCKLIAELLNMENFRSSNYLKGLAHRTDISEIHVTNEDSVVKYTPLNSLIGWRFPEDPKEQA